MKDAIQTSDAPAAIGPYAQAVSFGNLICTSGQIPLTPAGELAAEDIVGQTRQVLANLRAVLQAAGSDLDRVVKVTIFLQDMNDFAAVNGVYAEHFSEPYPARSTVEVSRLPRDVRIEVEAMAERH